MNAQRVAKLYALLLLIALLMACAQQTANVQSDTVKEKPAVEKVSSVRVHKSGVREKPVAPLALISWHETERKKVIQRFVKSTVDKNSVAYLPAHKRVAVFDLDGTLWVEKPQKPMVSFVKQELIEQVRVKPRLKNKQPWRSVAREDDNYLAQLNFSTSYLSLLKAHAGLTQAAYNYKVKTFFEHYQHSDFKRPQMQLAYQPLRELIRYLQAYDYKVYIVDGSENAFIRHFSQDLFNVPAENVIGSSALLIWREGSEKLVRHDEFVAPVNDRDGKPVNIERYIGQRPVIAMGNDASDIAMLNYVAENKSGSLVMYLKHDDDKREYHYASPALEQAAKKRTWLEISMKKDFKKLFQ